MECAVVYPLVFLFVIGLIIGAIGIFRWQEMSSLARRGARYASTHGAQYGRDTKTTPPTPQEIYNTVMLPNAAGLDTSKLSYSITYNTSNEPYRTATVNNNVVATQNTVTVTISYQWIPEAFLGGITLSSTSVMPMSN
jgi:hypothetical protein